MNNSLSFIPLGGIGDVTKNMYLYEYGDEILIIDCGLGFADETMLGVDLLLPDISYLHTCQKRIVGMLITHGHEDHVGALPFILPQLPDFPIFATPFTSALGNAKLKEYGVAPRIETVSFDNGEVNLGSFNARFVRVTHSVPDSANIILKTPIGTFYHGSDFKFDKSPFDGKSTDIETIKKAGENGVLCLLSDCLGAEKKGRTPSESTMLEHFSQAMKDTKGKFIVTTYSSHISRINQVIQVAKEQNRHICFIGRSFVKAKEVAQELGYLEIKNGLEVKSEELKRYNDDQLVLLVAGSQGQEDSAMYRIVMGEHRKVKLLSDDVIVFSADPIPGNEISVYGLIDAIAKRGIRVIYFDVSSDFHVSGHGSQEELVEMIQMTKPHTIIPIGGTFRHMAAYQALAQDLGYKKRSVLLLEDGQEVIFTKEKVYKGRTIPTKTIYVDEISGEEVEGFVLRDRQKLSEGGIVIVLCEINATNGQLIGHPDIIIRGFTGYDGKMLSNRLYQQIRNALKGKKGRVVNWIYIRKLIGGISERFIFKELRRRPLVLPVVIEV